MRKTTLIATLAMICLASGLLLAQDIFEAAKKGDLAKVKALVTENARVIDDRDAYSLTPLHYAALFNQKEVVAFLLEKGADIDARTADGRSALNLAEGRAMKEMAAFLVGKDADRSPQKFPVLAGNYFGQKQPGTEPEVFAPGLFSTVFHDNPPEVSRDMREMVWSRNLGMGNGLKGMAIMFSRMEGGRWTAPRPLTITDGKNNGYNPKLCFFGHWLVFCSNSRAIAGKRTANFPGTDMPTGDLWLSERSGGGWSEPMALDPAINSEWDDDCPAMADDGTLYFLSMRPNDIGPGNIHVARRVKNHYRATELLPAPINTKHGELPTYIPPDQSYLIFVSMRPEGSGSMDLYIAFRLKNGSWGPPVNMGDKINSPGVDTFGKVTPDGKFFFFSSNRTGKWFVYWVSAKILEDLKPKDSIVLKKSPEVK